MPINDPTGPSMGEDFQPTWALIKKPENYPDRPQVGKIEMIWNANYNSLYHRLSPFSNYSQNAGLFSWGSQPFYWVYPGENKGLAGLRRYESRTFPIGSAPIDVIRVSKFLVSGQGVAFLAKQFLLQTGNPYNETRIYNPTSPIVAAGLGITLGSARPQRFIDTSGGLAGIARSVLGDLGTTIFGEPKTNPPYGTAPLALTGGPNETTGGKGLLRAGDANRGRARLEKQWTVTGQQNRTFGSVVKNLVTSLFANFIPTTQDGIQYKSDEGAYGLMLNGGGNRFGYSGASTQINFGQLWWGGGTITRKNNNKVIKPTRLFVNYTNVGSIVLNPVDVSSGIQSNITDVGQIGYSPTPNSDQENKPGQRYGDSVGIGAMVPGDEYTNSDIMYQFGYYVDQKFPTKDPENNKDPKALNESLKNVIKKIQNSSGGIYQVSAIPDSNILRDGNSAYDYDRILKTNKRNSNPINYDLGVLKQYRDSGVALVDLSLTSDATNSPKLPTNNTLDAINTLEVLDKDKSIKNSKVKGWTTWEPYKDDLIALFFYDVVNEKYIPFRASVKGLNETGTGGWEEIPFIGRADKVYSYGGFNRVLNFNLRVVIGSIAELIPTWQRINYICTSIKPANYTKAVYNNVTDRFMVPPMFMLTLGDMYRDQPILIQNVTLTIPDDAAWETLNEDNSGNDWNYLASMIKAPNILFGQWPREAELGFTLVLLEKERAVVGGANFGHAPRNEEWSGWNLEAVPNPGDPRKMHKKLVVPAQTFPVLT